MNSIRNKFDCLTAFTKNEVGILTISETKLNSSFPQTQSCMNDFSKPYKVDGNNKRSAFINKGSAFILKVGTSSNKR